MLDINGKFLAEGFAHSLDGLSALLLQWPQPRERPVATRGLLDRDMDWEEESRRHAQQEDTERLLALARYIVVRSHTLRTLSNVDPEVRRKLHLRTRLRNLERAHGDLIHLLKRTESLAFLVKRLRTGKLSANAVPTD